MNNTKIGLRLSVAISFVMLSLCLNLLNIHALDNRNTITFDNQSGKLALVKLIGPTARIVEVPYAQSRTVNVSAGQYYILTRYGISPKQYSYSKGNPFIVRDSATQYSAITITLHKVIGGNYPSQPSSRKEFDRVALAKQTIDTTRTTFYQAQKILAELGYNPGQIDGIWGRKTEKALQRFQRDSGLPVTGQLDDGTKQKLGLQKGTHVLGGQPEPEMVLIPAGAFLMGSTKEDADWVVKETGVEGWADLVKSDKRRKVYLKAFYIGKYEVTMKEYKRFIDDTGHRVPGIIGLSTRYDWTNESFPKNLENHPVVLISQNDAKQYCEWLSKLTGKRYRLPTKEEWEKAASWDYTMKTKVRYPWGNDYKVRPNATFTSKRDFFHGLNTMPAGSVDFDRSPYGVYDMGGNVSEWVVESGFLKGGSFANMRRSYAVMNMRAAESSHSRDDEGNHVWRGFRVVRDP